MTEENKFFTYLINLDGSDTRLRQASDQLRQAKIEFSRISAFDGRGIDKTQLSEYDEKAAISFYGRPMTGGEIGCYKSHLDCIERFLNSSAKYCVVVEDDANIDAEASGLINKIIEYLDANDPDWEIVNIGKEAHKLAVTACNLSEHDLQRAFYFPVTTTGLIWSRKGAEAFWATRNTIFAPVDHFFRKFFTQRGTGYALEPPIVRPSGSESEIDTEGGTFVNARKRIPRTPHYFFREFRRQTQNYYHAWKHRRSHL